MKPNLRLVTPDIKKRTVALGRKPNEAYRAREYLTDTEVASLRAAAKAGAPPPEI